MCVCVCGVLCVCPLVCPDLPSVCGGGSSTGADRSGGGVSEGQPAQDQTGGLQKGACSHTHTHTHTPLTSLCISSPLSSLLTCAHPSVEQEVLNILKESKADIFVDPVLHTACALDIKHHCAAIPPGRGRREDTHTHACSHTHTRTHTHILTRSYTHTHTHVQANQPGP